MSTTEETTCGAPIEAAPEQTATETTPAPAADSTAAPSSNEAAAVAAEPAPVTEQPPAAQPEAATTQPTSAEEPVPSSAPEPAQATTDDSAAPQPQGDAPSAVEPVNPPADKRPPETLEEFEAEANELERELAALNEEAAAAETRTTTATDEKAAVDALEEALAGKVQHRDERQSHRAEVEEATVAIEARAASRDGTSDAVDQTAALEEFLAGGRFANMWDVTVSTDDMAALVDAAAVDGNPPSDVLVALQATKDHHAAEEARADEIQAKTAAAKKERIDKNASLLDRFERANNADLRRLNAMKPRIRSALDEQRFHLKRGTHIKAATITRKPKDEFLSLEQAKKQHSKMTETLLEEEDQIAIIDDEIETLKREKTHLLKTSAVEKAALLSNIEKLNKEVEGVAWEQKTLEDENQTMRDTRRDMIRTATQVRHQLRV